MTSKYKNSATGSENRPKRKTKALSGNTNAAITDVMEAIKNLCNIYEEETAALKKPDTKKFMSMQDRKVEAAYDYQDVMAQIMSRKNELASADLATKERLRKLHADFREISKSNLEAIERMKKCSQRLGNTIRNAAVKAARQQNTYSYCESGQISGASKRKAISSGLCETA